MSAEKLKYWYCPNCRIEIDSQNVTFEEKHDTCGYNTEWIEQTQTERERKLYEALDELTNNQHRESIENALKVLEECKPEQS